MVQKILHPVRDFFRANFIAGMFVAMPTAITVATLVWLWNWMDEPLSRIFGFTSVGGGSWGRLISAVGNSDYRELAVPFFGLCVLLLLVLITGIVVRSFIGRQVLRLLEGIVARMPLVGVLYISIKQLAEAFITTEGKSRFQSAVLVQFPMKGSWVIGFVTGSATGPLGNAMSAPLKEEAEAAGLPPPEIITVFIPTTPLPTQGFTLVLPKTETRELPISVPAAIKLVISGGIIGRPEASDDKTPAALLVITDEELKESGKLAAQLKAKAKAKAKANES